MPKQHVLLDFEVSKLPKEKLYLVGRSIFEDAFTCNILELILHQRDLGILGQHLHLLQDAVNAAKNGNAFSQKITHLIESGVPVSAQKEDIMARGNFNVVQGVEILSYEDLIDLIFDSEKICSDI
ncbi:MAG: sulfurtransferase complex subunit TusB [Promethearchaeota archaeon]